jgi:tRNA modification GTPase
MSSIRTIFALSTAAGKSGVAVIRISGPEAFAAAQALVGRMPQPRTAGLRKLVDPTSGILLDEAIVLFFPKGGSFTGEEVVELQVHGSGAVVQAVLKVLAELPGLDVAEPGEFTRQAFENGRLDLGQVEALGDLIEAETESQRRQAIAGLGGALGAKVDDWRRRLLDARALVAAEIDFSDEGDVGEDAARGIDSLLEQLAQDLQQALDGANGGRIVQDGYRVVLCGAPNVGKSTLLNTLARSDVAIVTEHAGTTRDVIEVRLDISGFAVVLQDTAGLRHATDPVELIGIERTKRAIAAADLVLWLDDCGGSDWEEYGRQSDLIRIRTKSDCFPAVAAGDGEIAISALRGDGIDSLLERMRQKLSSLGYREPPVLTRRRHVSCVERALEATNTARRAIQSGVEFVDEDIRRAEIALQELVGKVHVEDVLGAIFSRFCVGK